MIIAVLIVFGLCLGSFVNALVWRVHEQDHEATKKRPNKNYQQDLSIAKGRSMCPDCKHTLAAKDLLPVLSWLSTAGKCRYCKTPISSQYPVVELATAALFVLSYVFWPYELPGNPTWDYATPAFSLTPDMSAILLGLWLLLLTGLMALFVYDLRWKLLPNRIIFPLSGIAAVMALLQIAGTAQTGKAILNTVLAILVGGGIFYVLFQVSAGKWIGGGDVKLGWLLGAVFGTPTRAMLCIFIAAFVGSLLSAPMLATKKMSRTSTLPFGPLLIIGAVIVQLFGHIILSWYQRTFLFG